MTFNQEIFYLSLVLFSFLSILFVIFGYLIFTKTRENKNLAKIEQYKEQYQLPLFYYLKEGKPIREIDELDSLQRVAFIELLASFSKTFDGKEIHHQIQLFAKDHFTSFLRSQLFHRRWSYRMNALYWMEEFRMNHMQSSLIHFLTNTKKLSKGEEIQALKTLILSGNSTVMKRLCSSRNELSEFEYSMLFQLLNDNQFNEFITAYKDLPEVMKFALIDSIGVRRETNFVHFLEELTSHEQKGNPNTVTKGTGFYRALCRSVETDCFSGVPFMGRTFNGN
ncbi:hypothetical protein [Bacillus coahuilensis]|uniref:hypothetical protein n=1 Tax=Bacillus coahuilensis TaxID=408580 RepID=UPI0002F5B15E|nr:hypothetical protein [Bacillus coahuilensis]